MLAIRLQRTGRKGHAQFRIIVQEARRSPKSGTIVYALGSYDPHTKVAAINKDKAAFYLTNGAQPSSRVALLLQKEGVALPAWVKLETSKKATIKNADKRRSTAPAEPEAAPESVAETATETEETTAQEEGAVAAEATTETAEA
jgi:small subunit ribosomal protein S16